MSFRRIVTGHNAAGRSTVLSDGPSANVLGALTNHWTITSVPAPIDAPDPTTGAPLGLHPPHNGIMFRFFQIPPARDFAHLSRDELYAATRDAFRAIGGEDSLVDTTRHPAMHKTRTVDFIILLSGSITLMLDEEEVSMQPFDTVIQRGTNHAWINTGDQTATLMAVLIDGQ